MLTYYPNFLFEYDQKTEDGPKKVEILTILKRI